VKILILAGLFVALNAWQFRALVRAWMDDPNWSHGFLIPLFSLYLIYSRWSDLLAAGRRVCLWGLPIMLLAILFTVLGVYPIGTRLVSQANMAVLMFALVLYLAGPAVARITWLPIFFLLFAMPIPEIIYSRIAEPLQELAAAGSAGILRLAGVEINATSSSLRIISLGGHEYPLTVAEACAGMRLLIAFLALGVAMAYLGDHPMWQRIVLVAAGIPIAVLCNVIRVTITCSMYVLDRPELGQDFMHSFTGIIMLGPALLMLWLLGLLLRSLFVEVDEDDQKHSGKACATESAQK
jgi:exosortase